MSESRLTFARLVLELHRRADGKTASLDRRGVAKVLTDLKSLAGKEDTAESAAVRQILAMLVGLHRALKLEGRALDALSPETIWRLDAVLKAFLEGTIQKDEVRTALRRALIRPAH